MHAGSRAVPHRAVMYGQLVECDTLRRMHDLARRRRWLLQAPRRPRLSFDDLPHNLSCHCTPSCAFLSPAPALTAALRWSAGRCRGGGR